MYANGQGVEKNLQEAINWFEKAIFQGYEKARENLEIVRQELAAAPDPAPPDEASGSSIGEPARPLQEAAEPRPPSGTTPETKSAAEYFHFGNVHAQEGRYEQAIAEFKKAIALDPNNANTYENLAISYAKTGDNAQAAKTMRIAVQLRPNDATKYSTLGIIFHANNESDKAIVQYIYAARLNPGLEWLYYNMAVIYIQQNKFEKAWKCAKLAKVLGHPEESALTELRKIAPEAEGNWQPPSDNPHLRQIVVPTEEQAEDILKHLRRGENFGKLAAGYSLEANGVNGGYIGPLSTEQELPAGLIELPILTHSQPFKTASGFHIYQKIPVAAELLELP